MEALQLEARNYSKEEYFALLKQSLHKLESFKEYILIDSRRMRVDTFYRETNQYWHIGSYYEPDHEVNVRTLDLQLPLRSIYADVVFPDKP